ncbi:MAG: hypothetical protein JWM11_126 [Planctomycetaceae bacterium]|nr:hypothetical protein [Planctomycetaceae bacterium]
MDYQLLRQRGALNDARYDADEIVASWARPSSFSSKRTAPRHVDLSTAKIPSSVTDMMPASICWENVCIPYAKDEDRLYVAVIDADNVGLADKLSFVLGQDVRLTQAPERQIRAALIRHGIELQTESVDSILNEFTETACDFTGSTSPLAEISQSPSRPASALRSSTLSKLANSQKACRAEAYSRQTSPRLISDPSRPRLGMFFYTIPDGTRVLMTRADGTREILVGPKCVWRGRSEFQEMMQYIAHPGDYLIIRFRDGHQEHVIGPAEVWRDPRIHDQIERAEGLQIASKEAVVVYSHTAGVNGQLSGKTTRRIVYGPDLFVPQPGEWLHTFSWHASKGGSEGVEKVPNGLVFQKLWLMPDQMYHDVHSVRTQDDAVLTIRLMIFFELVDINLMLDATHDPIGDFVNAATADVVEFTGRFDFEAFKHNTEKLNEIATYKQLASRARQNGYHIHTVVYRGYGAANSLQQMHNQAIEARTKLQLDRATEQQSQELESFRLESQLARAAKRRSEQGDEVRHELELNRLRSKSELEIKETQHVFVRDQRLADAKVRDAADRIAAAQQQSHFSALREMGVDLTSYLTQNRADQVFEFRGQAAPQVHVDAPKQESNGQK